VPGFAERLHVVSRFACLREAPLAKALCGEQALRRRQGTQAWQKSLLIRRDALRPPHLLGGVAKVAPYSSRRHPILQ